MPETGQGANSQVFDLLYRHRSTLIGLAVLAFIVWMQWPMIKGSFYRFLTASAPADGIAWRTDFQAALAEAGKAGKPLLLDFSASWCPPCQVMKHDVWPDAEVREAVEAGYIPVLLDAGSTAGQGAAQRYQVSSVPTVLVVAADGRVLRRSGYMTRRSALSFLKSPA